MPTMPSVFRAHGASKRDLQRAADADRGSAGERGYDSAWAKASAAFKRGHPVCQYCDLEGEVSATDVTDHLYPQRTYPGVFWEQCWWVACCSPCHNGFKQRVEREGKAAIDALASRLGRPLLVVDGVGGWSKL